MGYAIKLLATSKKVGDTYMAMVAPFLLPKSHPLFTVNDVFNAIFVHGNMLGDAMFYGSGAGKLPTASAVVADMVDIAKHVDKNIPLQWRPEKLRLADADQAENMFFVRTDDTKEKIREVFGDVKFVEVPEIKGEFGFVTPSLKEKEFYEKIENLTILSIIRVGK